MEMNWIPAAERLPEKSGLYFVTTDGRYADIATLAFYDLVNNAWYTASDVIAWMPLPKPYGEESKVAASSDVNHPSHYNIAGRKECIVEMLETFGVQKTKAFCELNAYKYRYRAGLKGDAEKDFAKADWYEDYSKSLEEQHDKD